MLTAVSWTSGKQAGAKKEQRMVTLKPYHRIADRLWVTAQHPRASDQMLIPKIRELAARYRGFEDPQLATACCGLREQVAAGAPVTDLEIVLPCFALVTESMRRTLGLTLYDVQLLSGIVLSTGAIADVKTGEGKTLIISLPASLYGLTGRGVHVATVNRYLAQRDYEMLKPVYERLGLSVGISLEQHSPTVKRAAYLADITYATGYEFGFDYLRDQTRIRAQPKTFLGQKFRSNLNGMDNHECFTVQREHAMVIIDEADSVLIDEANTPLVLSGARPVQPGGAVIYGAAREVARQLLRDKHYTLQPRNRRLFLNPDGQRAIFAANGAPPDGLNRPWTTYVENALSAEMLYTRDVDYVVRDDTVMIVDQYTGRVFTDRTWREGLHQAIEAKEGVTVTAEAASIARISRQRYFRLYQTISGVTGTALGLEDEFRFFYRLPVVLIPEQQPCRRKNFPTRYFANIEAKHAAIVADVRRRNRTGQPILVGTRTIDESLQLSRLLRATGVSHRVLNGVQDESEAELVALAGQPHAVTIATNMAGRGTDIRLGPAALESGGLHVIATQRQESRRIDRQLIGRAARQGDSGSCQFFVCAADDLLVNYGESVADQIVSSAVEGESNADWSGAVRRVQRTAERARYDARCALFQQDKWLNDVLSTVAEQDQVVSGDQLPVSAD